MIIASTTIEAASFMPLKALVGWPGISDIDLLAFDELLYSSATSVGIEPVIAACATAASVVIAGTMCSSRDALRIELLFCTGLSTLAVFKTVAFWLL